MRPEVKASIETHIGRAIDALRDAALRVALALALVWWAPAIMVALARFPLGRLRFWMVLGAAAVLREVGAVGAARWIYRRERDRAGRRMAAIRARRGW